MAGAEARRSQLELQAEAAGEERRSLARALEELQLSCAAGQADVAAAQRDLDAVRDKVTSLLTTSKAPGCTAGQAKCGSCVMYRNALPDKATLSYDYPLMCPPMLAAGQVQLDRG